MDILFVNHSPFPNGASTVLNSLILTFENSSLVNSLKTITFNHLGLISFSTPFKKTSVKPLVFTQSFVFHFTIDLILFLPNLLFILSFIWFKYIRFNTKYVVYWNTLSRLWYIPFLSLLSPTSTLLVCHCHEAPLFFTKRKSFIPLYIFYSHFIDLTICVSRDTASHLASFYFPQQKIKVIHNPVSSPNFILEPPNLYGNHSPTILFIAGSLSKRKGIDIFIEAVNNLLTREKDPRIIIIGDSTPFFHHSIKALKLDNSRVTLLPPISLSTLQHLAVDFAVFPSRSEAQPLLPLELASINCPLILSDIPSHRNLFSKSQATFFRQGCPESLSLTMLSLMKIPNDKMLKMVNKSRERVELDFSITRVQNEVLSAITPLLISQS